MRLADYECTAPAAPLPCSVAPSLGPRYLGLSIVFSCTPYSILIPLPILHLHFRNWTVNRCNYPTRHSRTLQHGAEIRPSTSSVPPQRLPKRRTWWPDGPARLLQPTSPQQLRLAEPLPAARPGLRPAARPVRPASAADVLPARAAAATGPGHVPATAAKEWRWRRSVRRAVRRSGVLLLPRLPVLREMEQNGFLCWRSGDDKRQLLCCG